MPAEAGSKPHTAAAFRRKRPTQVRAHTRPPAKTAKRSPSPVQSRLPHRTTARPAQSSEPILLPKLQIQFADFPYLHCSINQRLFTLETCCGYGYDLAQRLYTNPDFQGSTRAHRTPQETWCFTEHPSLSPIKSIPGRSFLNKKRKLSPGPSSTSPGSIALPLRTPKRQSLRRGSGILTRLPFGLRERSKASPPFVQRRCA